MKTNLVVADAARTEKTICLAVSPSLKAYGIAGRARLFEVVQRVEQVNAMRRQHASGRQLRGQSENADTLAAHPELALSFITAPPQMANYIRVSTQIYQIYLKYFAPEDIHVYSIDEVFIDASPYLRTYGQTPQELARTVILDVLRTTGITATPGSARICIWRRSPWISGPSTWRRMKAACALPASPSAATAKRSGRTGR